jgi:hypothetical protein
MSLQEVSEILDLEWQIVNQDNDLEEQIHAWHHIFGHLDERLPENDNYFHKLNRKDN